MCKQTFCGEITKKENLWYRKNYSKPAPIPIKLGDLIQEFWPEEETEWLFECEIDEAVRILDFAVKNKWRSERDLKYLRVNDGFNRREILFNVKWKRQEFYDELIKNPLTQKDIDFLVEAGLSFGYNARIKGEACFRYNNGKPQILFFDVNGDGKFDGSLEHKVTLVHEILHGIFRVPSVIIERPYGFTVTEETNVEEVINYEARKICIKQPELVDYAIKSLGI